MSLKVILTEKVRSLGNIGEIVRVAEGYARNYLLPRRLAVIADETNTSKLNAQQRQLAKKLEAEKQAAVAVQKKINSLETIELVKRVGANGKLFGTVTTAELSKILENKGIDVERRLISVDVPIKQLGTFDIKVKLFHDVEGQFKVKIVMDAAQIEENKKRQEEAKKAKERKAEQEAAAAKEAEAAKSAQAAEE